MAKIALAPRKRTAPRKSANLNEKEQRQIAELAYQFFVERGYQHGHHEEDWLRAEAIVRARRS